MATKRKPPSVPGMRKTSVKIGGKQAYVKTGRRKSKKKQDTA